MNYYSRGCRFFYCIIAACFTVIAFASDEEAYLAGDPQSCLGCHGGKSSQAVVGILKTPHAQVKDPKSPFGQAHACQSCHGPSAKHMQRDTNGIPLKPAITFNSKTPVSKQNAVCLSCHQKGNNTQWHNSQHDFAQLSCSSCHSSHKPKDPVLGKGQQQICLTCHQQQRVQIQQFSSHPLAQNLMQCSDCHDAHGGLSEPLLVKNSLNETCYGCHAETRGPFLWEHAPVREDCSLCHKSHGSNHPNLLAKRQPWICQECHMAAYHPSTAYSGTGLSDSSPGQSVLGKSCTNCHARVHGSNHPSGTRQTR
jgi:DmsE family decaheme c-type cytochrome